VRINHNLMARADYTEPAKINNLIKGVVNLERLAVSGDDTAHAIWVDLKTAITHSDITAKQKNNLLMMAEGYTYLEIAAKNSISPQSAYRSIYRGTEAISKYLEPKKNEKKFVEGGDKWPPTPLNSRGNKSQRQAKRIITVKEDAGRIEYEGEQYQYTLVKNVCSRCGSECVEKSMYHYQDDPLTKKSRLIEKWVCWGCEVDYDIVSGIGTKEGLFHE